MTVIFPDQLDSVHTHGHGVGTIELDAGSDASSTSAVTRVLCDAAAISLNLPNLTAISNAEKTATRTVHASRSIGICMKTPCGEGLVLSSESASPCAKARQPWILAATILGSRMAFVDSTVVNVAVPALEMSFHASLIDVQWVVESYGIFSRSQTRSIDADPPSRIPELVHLSAGAKC